MKAVELCYILKHNYKEGKFQCNMDSCGGKPCDLCTVEKFEKGVRAEAIKNFAEWLESQHYLSHIAYEKVKDMDVYIVKEENLNADTVLAEYEKEERNGKDNV